MAMPANPLSSTCDSCCRLASGTMPCDCGCGQLVCVDCWIAPWHEPKKDTPADEHVVRPVTQGGNDEMPVMATSFDTELLNRHTERIEVELALNLEKLTVLEGIARGERERRQQLVNLLGQRRMEWDRVRKELLQLVDAAADDGNRTIIDGLKRRIEEFWK